MCDCYSISNKEDENIIGSYPSFTQIDPRNDDPKLQEYSINLLTLNSEKGTVRSKNGGISKSFDMMWGDLGIAQFLIKLEDLKNKNFSDVLCHWDCG